MKPTEEEWNIVSDIGTKYILEEDKEIQKRLKRKYFKILHKLMKKYGDDASILASLADQYNYNKSAIKLLEKAYKIAQKENDMQNLSYISSSLSLRYLNSKPVNWKQGKFWVKRLENDLKNFQDDIVKRQLHDCYNILRNNIKRKKEERQYTKRIAISSKDEY